MNDTKNIPRGTSPPEFMPGTYQYGHGTVRLDELTLNSYDSWLQGKPHWTDTATGKAAIEIVSRATLGAFFYSWMDNGKGVASMSRYTPENFKTDPASRTWLQWPAYAVDQTIGKVIGWGVEKTGRNPEDTLKFRELRKYGHGQFGRSLGSEMTTVTASFAAMSAGSGIMRTILMSVLNPRMRSTWFKDGRFELGHSLKRFAKEAWTIATKNVGEDIVVALPYVFFMRHWRNFVNVVFPGFKFSSDNLDNGGGVVLNDEGKVAGHYALAGALDLQGRFSAYNVFTQYYRDSYDRLGANLLSWRKNGYQLTAPGWMRDPVSIPERSIKATGRMLRYFTISSIRSVIQMTPSVPFFWLFRVPQGKKNGLAVHPEHGALAYKDDNNQLHLIRANQQHDPALGPSPYKPGYNRPLFWANDTEAGAHVEVPFRDRGADKPFEPFGFSKPERRLAHDASAKVADSLGSMMDRSARSSPVQGVMRPIWKMMGVKDVDQHISSQVDAAWAYAPYMAAKGFTRDVYVNDQMNLAIGRMLDGFLSFNWKEVKEGIGEITRTSFRLPTENPVSQTRLVKQHLHNPTDRSPIPANWSAEKHRELISDGSPDTHHIADLIMSDRAQSYLSRVNRKPPTEEPGWTDAIPESHARRPARQRPIDWTDRAIEQGGIELAPSVA